MKFIIKIMRLWFCMTTHVPIPTQTSGNDRLGVPLQADWDCPWIGMCGVQYIIFTSFPCVLPQEWALCGALLIPAQPPCLSYC